MDRWTWIRRVASDTISEYERRTSREAFSPEGGTHRLLVDLAERCFLLTVAEDPDLPESVPGQLDLDTGAITVSPALAPARKAFTIAHDMGHRALSHPARQVLDLARHVDEEPRVDSLGVRDGVYQAYSERDRWELEANVFAAELLAPVERVRAMVRANPNWTVERLRSYFGLSVSAMRNQLATALLPGPVPESVAPVKLVVGLSPRQEGAAAAVPPTLVIAGPGSGKTRVLVERFRHLVRSGVDPRRILALTFSNKAAEEMRERLAAALPGHEHAVRATTYHALGLELLRDYGGRIGLPDPTLLTDVDAFVLVRTKLGSIPLGQFEDLHRPTENLGLLLQTVSRAKDEMVDPVQFRQLTEAWHSRLAAQEHAQLTDALAEERTRASRALDAAAFYEAYQSLLRTNGCIDYGDLICESVHLFEHADLAAAIRGYYDHILVDEFQDINYASGRLVREIDGGRGVVWAVGDPRQSIYRFRGASPVNLANFTADYPGAHVLYLDTNYRSVEDIVRAGQAVAVPTALAGQDPPELIADRGPSASGPGVEVMEAAVDGDERAGIAAQVQSLAASRRFGEMAVLCRKRTQAQRVSDVLEERGIPTTWGGALDERPAFKDMMGVLLLAANRPQGLVRLARLPEHWLSERDLRGILLVASDRRNSALAALYAAERGEVPGLSSEAAAQAGQLKRLAGTLTHMPTPWQVITTYLFELAQWPRSLFTDESPQAQRTLATLGQVVNLTREFSSRAALVGREDCAAFVEYLRWSLEAGELSLPDDLPIATDAVHVLTVHRSKGLEWPVVFVPNAADGQFFLKDRKELPLPPGLVHGGDGDYHEEACLFYVALTRARDRLVVSRAARYGNRTAQPPACLDSMVQDLERRGFLAVSSAPAERGHTDQGVSSAGLPFSLDDPVPLRLVDTYDRCPRSFLYRYVHRLRDEDPGYPQFHAAVYAVMAWIAEAASTGAPPTDAAVVRQLEEEWEKAGVSGHWYEPVYRRRAREIVCAVARHAAAPGARAVREQVVVPAEGRLVAVTVDEIDQRDGERILRRDHFGREAKSHLKDDLLALLSAMRPKGMAAPQVRVRYPHLGLEKPVTVTPKVMANRLKKMRRLIDLIESGSFPAKPNDRQCSRCSCSFICPA